MHLCNRHGPILAVLALLILILILVLVLAGAGCSRVGLAYRAGAFLILDHAEDYVDLTPEQRARWEPRIDDTLARHRADLLPAVTAFVENLRQAAGAGFPSGQVACLRAELRRLHREHARLAAALASPLLADLTPEQIVALDQRFQAEDARDRARLAPDPARESRRRVRRYTRTIADWTGPLTDAQHALAAGFIQRIPSTQALVLDQRAAQRARLLGLLRAGAGEPAIAALLTDWLVAFADPPPKLARAFATTETLIAELLSALGPTLDDRQRRHLDDRLRALRDDLQGLLPRAAKLPGIPCAGGAGR